MGRIWYTKCDDGTEPAYSVRSLSGRVSFRARCQRALGLCLSAGDVPIPPKHEKWLVFSRGTGCFSLLFLRLCVVAVRHKIWYTRASRSESEFESL